MRKSRLGVWTWLCACTLFLGCAENAPGEPDGGGDLALGAACDADSQCAGGVCADGVCCDRACDGACEACAGAVTGGADGTCAPAVDGTVCRASAGGCDLSETCSAGMCPSDVVRPTGFECRAATGACDFAETCDGDTALCPADSLVPGGTSCRASTGGCDPEELCSGTSGLCPEDALSPSGTICREPAGGCDLPETCSGTDAACPSDLFAQEAVVCRASAGPCDVSEGCPGGSPVCPADAFMPMSAVSTCAPYMCGGTASCATSCTMTSQCAPGHACSGNVCVAAKRAFITSGVYNGNLGGHTGADAICQGLANGRSLGGTWRAWISTSTSTVSARFTRHAGPYVTLLRTKIADSWTDLTDGSLDAGLQTTETLGNIGTQSARIWTGTTANGGLSNSHCASFSSNSNGTNGSTGMAGFTDTNWFTSGDDNCNNTWHLYCFEQ